MPSRSATTTWAALMVVAVLAFAPAASATNVRTTVNGVTVDVTTAAPAGGRDDSILNQLHTLIYGAPQGSRIRVAAHAFGSAAGPAATTIRQDLMDAKTRGVDVKVVHSGQDQNDFTRALRNHLNANNQDNHRWCDHGVGGGRWACISTAVGTMHTKFMTFSNTWGVPNVSWFGSANFADGSIIYTHNNSITVLDNADMFNALNGLWNTMWSEPSFTNNDFYAPPRGRLEGAGGSVIGYASPEQDTDLVVSRLDAMTTGAGCSVYISNWHFTRTAVLNKLRSMKSAGCTIGVIVNQISSEVLSGLKGAGIPVRQGPTHDKMMLIHSSSTPNRVLTGSQNLTQNGLRDNDELLMQINGSQGVFNAMADHWWRNWFASTDL